MLAIFAILLFAIFSLTQMLDISAFLLLFCNFSFHPDPCYFRYLAIFLSPRCLLFLLFLLFCYFGFHSDAYYIYYLAIWLLCYFAIFNLTQMLAISAIRYFAIIFTLMLAISTILLFQLHSNSPNPGALGPGTARNSEMSVSGNSQSSTSLYIVSYRHKLLLYMYMYTTIKNTSSVTILWKILRNFVA